MIPHTFVLESELKIFKIYNGYWYWGRPTMAELHVDLRGVFKVIRPDFELAARGWGGRGNEETGINSSSTHWRCQSGTPKAKASVSNADPGGSGRPSSARVLDYGNSSCSQAGGKVETCTRASPFEPRTLERRRSPSARDVSGATRPPGCDNPFRDRIEESRMNTVDGQSTPGGSPSSEPADLKLEAVVIPVAEAPRHSTPASAGDSTPISLSTMASGSCNSRHRDHSVLCSSAPTSRGRHPDLPKACT